MGLIESICRAPIAEVEILGLLSDVDVGEVVLGETIELAQNVARIARVRTAVGDSNPHERKLTGF